MRGKTVVVTGATSGIGAAAVEALAKMGARIVFVARDVKRAEALKAKLAKIAPGLDHRAHLADLSLMSETQRVGAEIAQGEPRIDVLINNAGAFYSSRQVTAEGLELTFALNHMSYFLLTRALLDRLKASTPARIVSTASRAHMFAKLDFDDLQASRRYGAMRAYGNSKLCNILFTRELARRLAGSGVTANCMHPGLVASRFASGQGLFGLAMPLLRPFARTPEQGADTLVWLASSPDVAKVSGEYFADRKSEQRSPAARDDSAAARLWSVSEALAG